MRILGIGIISLWPIIIIAFFNNNLLGKFTYLAPIGNYFYSHKLFIFPLAILLSFLIGEYMKFKAEKIDIYLSANTSVDFVIKNLDRSNSSNKQIELDSEDFTSEDAVSDILLTRAVKCILGTISPIFLLFIGSILIIYVDIKIFIIILFLSPLYLMYGKYYLSVVLIEKEYQKSRRKLINNFNISTLKDRNNFFKKRLLIQQLNNSLMSFGFGVIISIIFFVIAYVYLSNIRLKIDNILLIVISLQYLFFGIKGVFSNISLSLRFFPVIKRKFVNLF